MACPSTSSTRTRRTRHATALHSAYRTHQRKLGHPRPTIGREPHRDLGIFASGLPPRVHLSEPVFIGMYLQC